MRFGRTLLYNWKPLIKMCLHFNIIIVTIMLIVIVIMFMFIAIVFMLIINTRYYAPFVYPKKKVLCSIQMHGLTKNILNEEKNFQEFIKIEQLKDYKSEK